MLKIITILILSGFTCAAIAGDFTPDKFVIKTKVNLPVSEATGKISLQTGQPGLDKKISAYGVKEIKSIFKPYKADAVLFKELEMDKFYLVVLNNNASDIKSVSADFAKESIIIDFAELNYLGIAAGVREKNNTSLTSLFALPNDEMFSRQWYLFNDGSISPSRRSASKVGADINMLKAWEIETGSDEIIVAILDSGIKDDHPDLVDRIWVNTRETPNNGRDDDGNGYADDYKGWNFAYENNRPRDGFGHGTNIATVIGASTNNNLGFAGVDQHCKLMNLKNLSDDNYGEYSWWAESIQYAVDNGADIINMSEGGDDYSRTLKTAVDYALRKDVMIVAAMMNKGDNKDYYPASFNGVFAVGATDTDDNRSTRFSWGGGSCWGKHISVVAPGNKIYGLDYEDDNNYTVFWSGTSQSTAIVSGLASLLKAQKPGRNINEIKTIIKSTAKDQVGESREDKPGWDQYYGYGRVDSYMALMYETPELIEETREPENRNDDRPARSDDESTRSTGRDANSKQPNPAKGR